MNTIRSGVCFAAVQGEGVIMDLVADRYFGLTALSARMWKGLQEGLSTEQIAESVAEGENVDKQSATELVTQQLETWRAAGFIASDPTEPAGQELPRPRPAGVPASIGLDETQVERTSLSLASVCRLLRASLWSHRMLKKKGHAWLLSHLQGIPTRRLEPAQHEKTVYRMARAYQTIRRPFKQGQQDCLLRSIALALALRRQGINAELCYGVQKFPFLAHAWVEANGTVLNEATSRLRKLSVLARF